MLLSEATAYLQQLVDLDLDLNVGTSPTDQQLCDLLWWSARRLYQDVDYLYSTVAFDPQTGDQQFFLHDDTISATPQIGACLFHVDAVRIADYEIEFCPWPRFNESAWPLWRTASNDTPVVYTVTPDLILAFNCPFSASCVADGGFGITGRGCPRRFDGSQLTEDFAVHQLLQWPVIRGAVPYATDAYVDSPQGINRLRLYDRLAEADRRRFDELSTAHNSPLADMPATDKDLVF